MSVEKNKKSVVPAEWEKQDAVLVGFPSHSDLWPGSLLSEAQEEVAALCNVLAETQTCYVFVANKETFKRAEAMLTAQANIIHFDFGDIWFRDIAPIFLNPNQCLSFRHNGWGGKYIYPYDESVSSRLVEYFDLDFKLFDFVLEGGALDHNGDGAILTSRQCLLNRNRNAWPEDIAEQRIKEACNAKHIYWIDKGLAYDHTDGHIDNAARYVSANKVVCQHAVSTEDPNATLFVDIQRELKEQGLELVNVPSPGLIRDTQLDIMPASHLNFVIANECLIFPNYLKYRYAKQRYVDETKEVLADLFPNREIMTLASNAILTGGGSFHCISQHIPA